MTVGPYTFKQVNDFEYLAVIIDQTIKIISTMKLNLESIWPIEHIFTAIKGEKGKKIEMYIAYLRHIVK